MSTLLEALTHTPRRQLHRISRQRGLRFSSSIRKGDLIQRLLPTLLETQNLEQALATLTESERQLLASLLAAGGRHRRSRYPSSLSAPLDRLHLLGLIFYDRATDDVFIPTELTPLLPALDPLPLPPPASRPDATGADQTVYEPALIAAHDLAQLLALLQANEVTTHPHPLTPSPCYGEGEI